MRISLDWLNTYLTPAASLAQVEERLTAVGLPVEDIESITGGDSTMEVEVTSNRPDCLSHVGLAREMASATGGTLKLPVVRVQPVQANHSPAVVTVQHGACPLYTARIIRGVKVGQSPDWLVRRLEAVGLRSVNNVVDVTNFVLMEMGQPLHTFDLAKLKGHAIVVRMAHAGEKFAAIDGSKHDLKEGMLVIADQHSPAAIAGVMGGKESEVTLATADLLLESAIFDPLTVRKTSRALKLSSDSSYRFERGVDPAGVAAASDRAAQLIVELAGGRIEGERIRVGQAHSPAAPIKMRLARCNAVLGVELSREEIVAIFSRLGLQPSPSADGQTIACTIPSWRLDLKREVDLIEEAARHAGLERIPVSSTIQTTVRPVQPAIAAQAMLRQVMSAHGYLETVTFSFVSEANGNLFLPPGNLLAGDSASEVKAKPSSRGVMIDERSRHLGTRSEPMLRPSLLPSLLMCRKFNQDVGNLDVRLYEIASTWSRAVGSDQVEEARKLTMIADAPDAEAGWRYLRGTIEEIVLRLAGNVELKVEPAGRPWFSTAGRVFLDGQPIGWAGLISAEIQKAFSLQTTVAAAELDLWTLVKGYPPVRQVMPQPRHPAIERDLSLILDDVVAWTRLEHDIRALEPRNLEAVQFVTVYRGKPIPSGKKSTSLRLVFRDPARTLRHDEVDPEVARIVEHLKSALGAELRK